MKEKVTKSGSGGSVTLPKELVGNFEIIAREECDKRGLIFNEVDRINNDFFKCLPKDFDERALVNEITYYKFLPEEIEGCLGK